MSILSIRRRVRTLETLISPKCEYPPFTSAEIAAIAEQVRAGEVFGTEELARLQQHSPIVDGEFIVHAGRTSLTNSTLAWTWRRFDWRDSARPA